MSDLYSFKQKGDTTAGWGLSTVPLQVRQLAVEYPVSGAPKLKICPLGGPALFGSLPYIVDQPYSTYERDKVAILRSVRDYGAIGNGISDDTAAITAAISAMPARGGRLYFPTGVYKVSSPINVWKPGKYFGDGASCTCIMTSSATANTFDITSGDVVISDLFFDASVTKIAGAFIAVNANNFLIDKFVMQHFILGIIVQPTRTTVSIENGFMFEGLGGATAIYINAGFDISITNILMNSSVNIAAGVTIVTSGDVEMSRLQIIHADIGLNVYAGSGVVIASIWAVNCFFDTCGRGASFIAAGAGAVIVRCLFVQCWFSSASSDHGVNISTSSGGSIQGVDFVACHIFLNAANGIQIYDAGVVDVSVRDSSIAGNGQSGIAVVSSGTHHFNFTDNRIGNTGGLGPNLIGVFVPAGCFNYMVTGNNLLGNTNFNLADGGSAPKVVANNLI